MEGWSDERGKKEGRQEIRKGKRARKEGEHYGSQQGRTRLRKSCRRDGNKKIRKEGGKILRKEGIKQHDREKEGVERREWSEGIVKKKIIKKGQR